MQNKPEPIAISINSKGIGYVEINGQDYEIQQDKLKEAMPGDFVLATPIKDKRFKRSQAEVTKIVQRTKTQFVGTLQNEKGHIVLAPDDYRVYKYILLPQSKPKDLPIGYKAVVKVTKWEGAALEADLVRVIGKAGEHNTEMQAIIFEKGFDTGFPEAVVKEAEEIEHTQKPIPYPEIAKRKDFRQTTTFTIDPVDAKDFDDALSIKRLTNNHFEIGIHIADVSHYVVEKSALDKEASKRGFSVYLVDRTIPMLPEVLSNDICSLNPQQDRLAFSAVFEMDLNGTIYKRWFGKTVINSNKRFSYEEAQEVLNAKQGTYFDDLHILYTIGKALAKQKFAAGAIDFEKEEIRFQLDPQGRPLGVFKKLRLDTHKLVEDFMLLANKEVAQYIDKENKAHQQKEGALLYRIHDLPDPERITDLSIFIKALGYDLEAHDGKITSKAIRKLLDSISGSPEEELIKTATLRSMAKAQYSTRNIGHFGLAFSHYAHFTSPIRRYADLLVHRVLHRYLTGKRIADHEFAFYQKMAMETSKREISAAEAERASIKYKQVEYMSSKIGQEFSGVITGVTEWGIYVEELDTKCEGMVKLRDLNDFYVLNEKTYTLTGEKSKNKYCLGDKVKFKVAAADLERRTLDYKIIQ